MKIVFVFVACRFAKKLKKCRAIGYNFYVSLKTRRLLLKLAQYYMLNKGTAFSRNK